VSNTAEFAKLEYEAGQTVTAMSALTDSGDATIFTSAASLWSGKSGYTPTVRPNGLLTGGVVIPAAAAGNNNVDVSALTCNLAGVVTSVAAALNNAITRPATAVSKVNSITVNSSGAIAVVAGVDGTTTAFVETRGAAGGPPLIPVGSIEIAQVRVTSNTAAVITAAQIYSVVGTHTEMANYPLYNVNYNSGRVEFLSALPKIHTGTLAKGVYASYSAPIFSEISLASDFKPPETTHSVSSTQIYNTTLGSTSQTLGQGSFTAYLEDGISDALVQEKNENLWFRFYADRYKTPYLLTQGKLGISRTFPAGDSIQAACTISATSAALEVTA
jgi:hypothetical protein